MRKQSLTLDEHIALGQELHQIRDRLGALAVEVGHHYPVNGPVASGFHSARKRMDTLRSRLENQLFLDHPTEASIRVYCPGPNNS